MSQPALIQDMPTAKILDLIELMKRPAYRNLSAIHDEYFEDLKREACTRNNRL